MPLRIVQQELTLVSCDVIVNPTDECFSGSGGVDLAVHQTAGIRLRKACSRLAPLSEGEVCYTKGYGLRSRYVIHTVGPRWRGGGHNEAALLHGCYTKALALSEQLGASSIAFPLISSGRFRFPRDQVLRIAQDAISAYLLKTQSDLDVTLCVLDRTAYALAEEDGLKAFLAEENTPPAQFDFAEPPAQQLRFTPADARGAYGVETDDEAENRQEADRLLGSTSMLSADTADDTEEDTEDDGEDSFDRFPANAPQEPPSFPRFSMATPKADRVIGWERPARTRGRQSLARAESAPTAAAPKESLESWLKKQDDSFAVTLLKLIDKKGMTDVECYKRANVSRKTFSKINTQKNYKPSKQTVLAFAVGLQLTLEETETLLRTAGFSLSRSYVADRIVEYFIRCGNYDIYEINAALYQYDQVLLGC